MYRHLVALVASVEPCSVGRGSIHAGECMTHVVDVIQTCGACPSQWEGRTSDGRVVYVRYRYGWLKVGFGDTLEAAVDDHTIGLALGGGYDGVLSFEELKAATHDHVVWPSVCSKRSTRGSA